MGFKSVRECFVSGDGKLTGRNMYRDDDLVFSTDKSCGAGGLRYSMRVSIRSVFAKKARIIRGDLVDILFDEGAKAGLIKRVNSGGWKLTASKDNSQWLSVRITYKPGMPSAASAVSCLCEITDEGLVFTLPDEVSFTENLKARGSDSTPKKKSARRE